jgi:hypothetical protein
MDKLKVREAVKVTSLLVNRPVCCPRVSLHDEATARDTQMSDVRTKYVALQCAMSCCVLMCAVFSCHVALFSARYLCYAVNVIYQLPVHPNLPETPAARSPLRPPKSPKPKLLCRPAE